jgi:hypothetical protein
MNLLHCPVNRWMPTTYSRLAVSREGSTKGMVQLPRLLNGPLWRFPLRRYIDFGYRVRESGKLIFI